MHGRRRIRHACVGYVRTRGRRFGGQHALARLVDAAGGVAFGLKQFKLAQAPEVACSVRGVALCDLAENGVVDLPVLSDENQCL